ncbi:MAG: hypothetical protein L6455_11115 [Kiritimatiellae bacterium]|nr:hypothetical protein [Kiritimatiellia bacterium]
MNYRAIIEDGVVLASKNEMQGVYLLFKKLDLNLIAKEAATDQFLRKKIYDLGIIVAGSLIRGKKYDEAAEVLETLQNKFRIPNDSLLYYYRSLSLFGSGHFDDGYNVVQSAVKEVDDAVAALMIQAAGECGLKKKSFSKAYDIYIQGIDRFKGKKEFADVAVGCCLFASEAAFGLNMNEKSKELLQAVLSSNESPEWAKQNAADFKNGTKGLRSDSDYWAKHGNEESDKV